MALHNILIVDDEYYICEGLHKKLVQLNHPCIGEILTCFSGEEAISVCKTYKPHIIFTDIKMSGINGIELIHALRETLHPVQFIVLSGYDDFEYVRGAFQNGAIDYLLKPVLNDDLTRVVAAALSTLDANYRDPGKQRGTLFQFSADVLRKIVSLPISAPVPASLITNMEQIGIGPNCCIALVASLTPWNSDEATAYSNQIYDNFHHVLCNTIAESKLCILCDAKDYESLLAFLSSSVSSSATLACCTLHRPAAMAPALTLRAFSTLTAE